MDFIATREGGRGSEGFPGDQTQSPLAPRGSPSPPTPAGGLRPDSANGHWAAGQAGKAGSRNSHNQMSKSRNRSSVVNRHVASSPPRGPGGGDPDPAPSIIPSPVPGENGVSPELRAGCSRPVHHLTFPNAFGVWAVWKPTVCSVSAPCLTERRLGCEVALAIVDSIPPNLERAVTGSVLFWKGPVLGPLALSKLGMEP